MGHAPFRISESVKHILKQQCLGYLRLNAQFECIERDDFSQNLWEFNAAQIPFCMYRNLHNDWHQVAMLWIENALHLQNTITFDFNFQHHPNPIRVLAIGSRDGIEVYHFDISETESYAQSASNTWELLDRLPVGILVADLHTHQYVFLNQHLEKILGYSKPEIAGKTLDFLHLKDELDEVNKDFAQQIAGKIQYSRPFHFVKKNKETLQASVVQIHTEIDGKPYAIGVLKKRKWVFELLQKGYHQLNGDQVLSAFPHSVLVFERAGYLVQHHIKPLDTLIQALPIQIGAHFSELFPEAITIQLTDRFEMMNVQPQAMEWEVMQIYNSYKIVSPHEDTMREWLIDKIDN